MLQATPTVETRHSRSNRREVSAQLGDLFTYRLHLSRYHHQSIIYKTDFASKERLFRSRSEQPVHKIQSKILYTPVRISRRKIRLFMFVGSLHDLLCCLLMFISIYFLNLGVLFMIVWRKRMGKEMADFVKLL
jgi:hypothetical protein